MSAFQLQMLLMGYCVVMLVLELTAIGLSVRQWILTTQLAKELRAQRRQIGQMLAEQTNLHEAFQKQPNEIAEGARYLKKAADDIRWQTANKDIVISDQLDLLLKQYRMLVSMQADKALPPLTGADVANGGLAAVAGDGRPDELQAAVDDRAVRPRLATGRPVLRSEVKQLSARPVWEATAPATGADVVTLADHLSRYA